MAEPDAWDAEDFEPELPSKQQEDDKWAGEDEDKGNWDDDDKEGEDKKDSDAQAYQKPKKKPLAEKIAEKEAQEKKEKEEKKPKLKENKEMTAEEKQAEKERIRKVNEDQTLKLAKELFSNNTESASLDTMAPLTEAEFDKFGEALKSKVRFFEESQHYPGFMVQLINDLSLTLNLEEVKKLGININSLYHEKERQRKETEKKKKKKNKISIKVDRADDLELIGDATGGYFEDDDFI